MRSPRRIEPRSLIRMPTYVGVLILLLRVLAGCGPTAPEVRVLGPVPQAVDRAIFVTASRQKERVVRAMRGAGFEIVDRIQNASALLRVTVGVEQGSRPCGTLNNVRYALRVQGRTVIVAEAKGWTGSCEPNVFDEVSQEIKHRMVEVMAQEGRGK